jgi:hypothetical protein
MNYSTVPLVRTNARSSDLSGLRDLTGLWSREEMEKARPARLACGRLVCPATDSGYNLLVALEENRATTPIYTPRDLAHRQQTIGRCTGCRPPMT